MVVAKLGGVVEETLNAIKLIASFANEKKAEEKFIKISNQILEVSKSQ